jgi:hypothetical protein
LTDYSFAGDPNFGSSLGTQWLTGNIGGVSDAQATNPTGGQSWWDRNAPDSTTIQNALAGAKGLAGGSGSSGSVQYPGGAGGATAGRPGNASALQAIIQALMARDQALMSPGGGKGLLGV